MLIGLKDRSPLIPSSPLQSRYPPASLSMPHWPALRCCTLLPLPHTPAPNPLARRHQRNLVMFVLSKTKPWGYCVRRTIHAQSLHAPAERVYLPTPARNKLCLARGRRAPLDEAESAGAGGQGGGAGGVVEPLRVLGDAGLVLRDLSAMHLLSAQALALLQVGRGARVGAQTLCHF